MMKRLLRQGWVRAGIPSCSIESLADHSWSVCMLSYICCIQENDLRHKSNRPELNIEKCILIALFHDLPESEYLDLDKSIEHLLEKEKTIQFRTELEKQAVKSIISKLPSMFTELFENIFKDQDCEEFKIVRIADSLDLLIQTDEYLKKSWLNEVEAENFRTQALTQLKNYVDQFQFLKQYLAEINNG